MVRVVRVSVDLFLHTGLLLLAKPVKLNWMISIYIMYTSHSVVLWWLDLLLLGLSVMPHQVIRVVGIVIRIGLLVPSYVIKILVIHWEVLTFVLSRILLRIKHFGCLLLLDFVLGLTGIQI